MSKSDYHQLARFVHKDDLPPEIGQTLDAILATAEAARPAQELDCPRDS